MKKILAATAALTLLVAMKPTDKKYVALSFDDGPNTTTTLDVLDVLKENKVPASFFVIGRNVNDETAAVMKRAVRQGCEIESHTWSHPRLTEIAPEEIIRQMSMTDSVVRAVVGRSPQFVRPPFGSRNAEVAQVLDKPMIYGLSVQDWNPKVSKEKRISDIMSRVSDGYIILLHDSNGNTPTVETLKVIIPELKAQGYHFVTVSKLFKKKGITPELHDNTLWSNVLQNQDK